MPGSLAAVTALNGLNLLPSLAQPPPSMPAPIAALPMSQMDATSTWVMDPATNPLMFYGQNGGHAGWLQTEHVGYDHMDALRNTSPYFMQSVRQ